MTLIGFIIIIGLLFFIFTGAYFLFPSIMAPKNLTAIEKLIENNRFREAQTKLISFLEKDERNLAAHYLLASCYHKTSQLSEAVVEYRQALKYHTPGSEVGENLIRKKLARCFREMGNLNESKNEFLILTTKEPDNYENYFEVGKLFHESGFYDRAVNFFTKAVTANAKHAESWALMGQSQFQIKNYNEAKNSLLRTLKIQPDQKIPRYYLGLSLRFTGDLEWAQKELELASKENSIKDKAILALGMTYCDTGNFQKAISEFNRGLQYVSSGSNTALEMHYLLAMAAEKIKSIDLAIQNWETIFKIKPDYRDVQQKLSQYSDLRTHDSIKDFVIANTDQFSEICTKIIENMGLSVLNSKLISDNIFRSLAMEGAGKGMKKQQVL
ncbi:MAG: tetratricopeptide repeat protein, partial [Spirochaetia bacterium]|nr:tetratricopeptide repeat protein [Spirochaetia bacterium]